MQVLLPHTLETVPNIATCHMRAAKNGSLGATRARRAAARSSRGRSVRLRRVCRLHSFFFIPFVVLCCCVPVVLAVVVVFLGVARSLPAVADLRVLTTVEYAVAVAAAVSVGDVLLLLSCAVGLST